MENPVYNLSEGLICFVPVFLIISLLAAVLLWNSWPDKKAKDVEEGCDNEIE